MEYEIGNMKYEIWEDDLIMTDKKPTYAELKQELDELLDTLQQDNISVDDALKNYERGMELVKQLESTLKDAENKITKLKAKFN